jgi:hypothetical protein
MTQGGTMQIRGLSFPLFTAVLAAATLSACGGEERLSDEEFSSRIQPVVERISTEFGAVFQALGRAREDARVPVDVRARLRRAARVERDAAADAAELQPPQRAEASLDRLVAGARQQSARLEQLAGRPDLTVGQMADAVEGGAAVGALRELAEQGFVSPPGPS